jgi:branched-chain amino acid transport system permease protein
MRGVRDFGLIGGGGQKNFCIGLVMLAALALLPLLFKTTQYANYLTYVIVRMMIIGLYAMSYDVLLGFTGIFSFGHATFMGCGAYAVGILMVKLGLGLQDATLGVLLGFIAGLIMGFIMGYVASRVGRVAIFLVTFVFTESFQLVITAAPSHITGSEDGIAGIPRETIFHFINIKPELNYYYLVLILLVTSFLILRALMASPLGDVLVAVRENPQRVRFLGYRIRQYRTMAFMVAGAFGALAGTLTALHEQSVDPAMFGWFLSGDAVLYTVLGGPGTLIGPILGSSIVIVFQELLSTTFHHWVLFLGLSYMLLITFLPEGLLPLLKRVFRGRAGLVERTD